VVHEPRHTCAVILFDMVILPWCADPVTPQHHKPAVAPAEGTLDAATPALRLSLGSWWSQNVVNNATAAAAAGQQASTGQAYPSVSTSASASVSGQPQSGVLGPGEQQVQSNVRLSSSLSSGLNIPDSAASLGGSTHGHSQARDSIGGLEELRDSSQGMGLAGAAALSQGGAPNLRGSVTDQSDASSVSSISASGQAPGSVTGSEQTGMPAAVAGSSTSLGGLTGISASSTTPFGGSGPRGGAVGPSAASGSYAGTGFLANWSSGGAANPAAAGTSGFGGSSDLGAAGLKLSLYYGSKRTATGLLGGQRGSGVAAALREEAAWGIGRNSPRPTREPPSPVLRGLVTRPELALCLLTEVGEVGDMSM
jgi:hypothetical protein